MQIAAREGFKSLAFPALSCGVYGFPIEPGAEIAVQTVRQELPGSGVEWVIFAVRGAIAEAAFRRSVSGQAVSRSTVERQGAGIGPASSTSKT